MQKRVVARVMLRQPANVIDTADGEPKVVLSDMLTIIFPGRDDIEQVKSECLEAYPDAVGVGAWIEEIAG